MAEALKAEVNEARRSWTDWYITDPSHGVHDLASPSCKNGDPEG